MRERRKEWVTPKMTYSSLEIFDGFFLVSDLLCLFSELLLSQVRGGAALGEDISPLRSQSWHPVPGTDYHLPQSQDLSRQLSSLSTKPDQERRKCEGRWDRGVKRASRGGCYGINFCGDFNKLCLNILHLADKGETSAMRRGRRHLGEYIGKGCPRILTVGERESW